MLRCAMHLAYFFQLTNSSTMPIEIKELHIRITVNAPEGGAAGTGAAAAAGAAAPAPAGGAAGDKEALVAECVEQVLSILHQKLER